MTDQHLTEVVCVVDRSGSMGVIRDDAIGGFNTFLAEQQKLPGRCLMTIVQFDHEYSVVCDGLDIQKVKPFDDMTYVPRGTTALYDAIGRAIQTVGERLTRTPEDQRPGQVIVVILTDGMENSSREYNRETIKIMTELQQGAYNWKFLYLGANQDAFAVGHAIGMQQDMSVNYAATPVGIRSAYQSVSSYVSQTRTGNTSGSPWNSSN